MATAMETERNMKRKELDSSITGTPMKKKPTSNESINQRTGTSSFGPSTSGIARKTHTQDQGTSGSGSARTTGDKLPVATGNRPDNYNTPRNMKNGTDGNTNYKNMPTETLRFRTDGKQNKVPIHTFLAALWTFLTPDISQRSIPIRYAVSRNGAPIWRHIRVTLPATLINKAKQFSSVMPGVDCTLISDATGKPHRETEHVDSAGIIDHHSIPPGMTEPELLKAINANKNHIKQVRYLHANTTILFVTFALPFVPSSITPSLSTNNGNEIPVDIVKQRPVRCNNCQQHGHKTSKCQNDWIKCPNCAGHHTYEQCMVTGNYRQYRCANCNVYGHGAANRRCPAYKDYIDTLEKRNEVRLMTRKAVLESQPRINAANVQTKFPPITVPGKLNIPNTPSTTRIIRTEMRRTPKTATKRKEHPDSPIMEQQKTCPCTQGDIMTKTQVRAMAQMIDNVFAHHIPYYKRYMVTQMFDEAFTRNTSVSTEPASKRPLFTDTANDLIPDITPTLLPTNADPNHMDDVHTYQDVSNGKGEINNDESPDVSVIDTHTPEDHIRIMKSKNATSTPINSPKQPEPPYITNTEDETWNEYLNASNNNEEPQNITKELPTGDHVLSDDEDDKQIDNSVLDTRAKHPKQKKITNSHQDRDHKQWCNNVSGCKC